MTAGVPGRGRSSRRRRRFAPVRARLGSLKVHPGAAGTAKLLPAEMELEVVDMEWREGLGTLKGLRRTLVGAKNKVAGGWGRTSDTQAYCLGRALSCSAPTSGDFWAASMFMHEVVGSDLRTWNDRVAQDTDEVIAAIDRALELHAVASPWSTEIPNAYRRMLALEEYRRAARIAEVFSLTSPMRYRHP
jgi:hypothetical protein